MTAVEGALAEIDQRLSTFAPEHEGLRDYARLNITDDTRAAVDASIAAYDRRQSLLDAAKAALDALMADGHPDLDIRAVSLSVLADLQDNAATIEAALKRFESNAALSLGLVSGVAETK